MAQTVYISINITLKINRVPSNHWIELETLSALHSEPWHCYARPICGSSGPTTH